MARFPRTINSSEKSAILTPRIPRADCCLFTGGNTPLARLTDDPGSGDAKHSTGFREL